MLQIQIADSLREKKEAIYSDVTLYSALKSLNEAYVSYEKILAGISEPASKDTLHALGQAIDSSKVILSGVSSRSLFREIDLLAHKLNASLNSQSEMTDSISGRIEHFADFFDSYASQPSNQKALRLLLIGHELYIRIQTYLGLSQSLVEAYSSSEKSPSEGEAEMLLLLPAVETVEDAVNCLKCILAIYNEFCTLTRASSQSFPLKLCKIDSGSLWVKLFGESRTIGLVCRLIENAAKYAYRNHTVEGRAAAIPKKVETLKDILGLSKMLEEAGIDTSTLNQQLEKGAVALANEFNELIEGQMQINLNGKEISAKTELEALQDDGVTAKQLAGRSSRRRLSPSADSESAG
jgi:hypothetical protein